MDDAVNRFAQEMSKAIADAIAQDPRVEAVREQARAAGFELKVSLEAVIGFAGRQPKMPVTSLAVYDPVGSAANRSRKHEMSANDKRFLRSLRIDAGGAEDAVE